MICSPCRFSLPDRRPSRPGPRHRRPPYPLTVTCTTLSGGEVDPEAVPLHGHGSDRLAEAGESPRPRDVRLATRTVTWSNGKRTNETFTYKVTSGTADTCAAKAKYTKDYLVTEQGYVADWPAPPPKAWSAGRSGPMCASTS